jgi:Domain of unknown function (DUF4412)
MKCKALLIGLLVSTQIFAFEGVITQIAKNYMNMGKDFTFKWYINPTQIRMEVMGAQPDGKPYHGVNIIDAKRQVMMMYTLTPTPPTKMYLEIPKAEMRGDASVFSGSKTVEVKQVFGKSCHKWEAKDPKSGTWEWVAEDIDIDWTVFAPYLLTSPIIQVLAKNGVKGFPLQTDTKTQAATVVVNQIEAKPISRELFAPPTGYTMTHPDPASYGNGK